MESLNDLDSLWNPLDAPASEAAFRALIPEAAALTGADLSYLIELKALVARAQAVQEQYDDARATLKEAEELLEQQRGAYRASAKIRWLLERGRVHILEKTPSQARPLFVEAWTLATNSGEDYFTVDVAQMMAATEPQKNQQAWIEKGIEVAEGSQIPKTKRWLGGLYTSLGWKLFDLRQFEKSLETFQKAQRHLEFNGTRRETSVARWSAGKVLRHMGRIEEALELQEALLSEMGLNGERDGRLYEEIAECLHSLQRKDEARIYFEFAYRELSSDEWINDNQPLKLKRLKDLGEVK